MINPTDVNPLVLPSVTLSERDTLPEVSGIYFAIDSENTIQYIGRTVNVLNRWKNHHRTKQLQNIATVRVAYLTIDDVTLLDMVENTLIDYFQPKLNFTRIEYDTRQQRANLKLNSGVRSILKNLANQDGRSESSEVERLVIEIQALRNILKTNSEIASLLLPLLNDEIGKLLENLEAE
jgi:hypothetical protein